MSTSENHHAVSALDWSGAEMAERQIEATLALAYEQRTANLIAFRAVANTILASGTKLTLELAMQLDDVDGQIKERLGL